MPESEQRGPAVDVWLPSGQRCELLSEGSSLPIILEIQRWYRVRLQLCWNSMMMQLFIYKLNSSARQLNRDPSSEECVVTSAPTSFAPHSMVQHDERLHQGAGWQHLYLFTWLEQSSSE